MAKAADEFNTTNPDVAIIPIINRHDLLWNEWNRLNEIDEDHPEIEAISRECSEIELKVLLAPASTAEELEGKRRVVERGDVSDDFGIIDAIFALDAERISAAA